MKLERGKEKALFHTLQEKERQCLEEKLAAYEKYFGEIYKGAKHLKKMTKRG